MNILKSLLFAAAVLLSGHALALPDHHPANPEAGVPAFQPADHFATEPKLAAAETEHASHDHTAAGQDAVEPEEEGKNCKRGSGCCCCCKCGDKERPAADSADKKGCGMMKKMQGKEEGQPAGKDDEHASHH